MTKYQEYRVREQNQPKGELMQMNEGEKVIFEE
jgi:hypothetical protein